MSKHETPPAFPSVFGPDGVHGNGMTLRDYFAAKALCGLLSDSKATQSEMYARDSYKLADAMLAERIKK
jgi:hypothetical protein